MKNRAASIGIFFLGIAFFCTGAFAYDDLATNDTAETNAAGKFRANLGLVYLSAGKMYDTDGKAADLAKDFSQLRVPLKVSYGIRDRFTLFAVLPYVSLDSGSKTTSGIGDVWLGVKYRLLPENLLTLRGTLDLAVDSDDASSPGNPGGPGFDFAVMSMKPVGIFDCHVQAGLRLNGEDEDKFAPGTGFYLEAGGAYPIGEAIRGLAGIQFKSICDGKVDGVKEKTGNYSLDITLGAAYKFCGETALRGDVLYSLAGKRNPRNIGILIALSR